VRRRGSMERNAGWLLVSIASAVLMLCGCRGVSRAPGAVRPTLEAVERLGLSCGDGERDNVPSGLFQWHCGPVSDPGSRAILIGGNDAGVSDIDVVSPRNDLIAARQWFVLVVGVVPPLSGVEGLGAALDAPLATWTGQQQFVEFGGVRVAVDCIPPSQFGEGDCTATFVGPDPLKPIIGSQVTFSVAD
jgi:hypothetical protein